MEPFITREELDRIADEFISENYKDEVIEMYADYDEFLSDEQVAEILESNDPMAVFYETLDDAYIDARSYYIDELESEFDKWCDSKGYDCTAEDLRDEGIYLDEYVSIEPDYKHFLDHEYHCRLIVDNGDGNYDFTCNPNQDNDYQIEDGAGIIWLGEQLGYTVEQMQKALDEGIRSDEYPIDDTKNPDKFLDSLVHEAANAWGMVALTFLVNMTLDDLIKFKEEKGSVTVEMNGMNCGFFDAWNGGGSVLELEGNASSVTIPADKINELTVDIRRGGRYSVNEVYGLWGGAYADATVN